jgi:hypothetical protein
MSGVVVWESRMNNKFADYAFVFQRDDDDGDDQPRDEERMGKRFPFVMAMAYPFSALFQTLHEASESGGAMRDRTYSIPPEITKDDAVMECLLFFIYTGLVVDIKHITKQGTVGIFQALTHEAVARPEFKFDIMVNNDLALSFLLVRNVTSTFLQELYYLAAYLRMHQLTKKLREHCLFNAASSPTASYCYMERMLACNIIRCSRFAIAGESELLPATISAYVRMTKGLPCLCRY